MVPPCVPGIKGRTDSGSPFVWRQRKPGNSCSYTWHPWYGSDILKSIDTFHYPNGDHKAKIDQVKREKTRLNQALICLLITQHVVSKNRVIKFWRRHGSKRVRLKDFAPVFIDATGDGWLGYWAGADYRQWSCCSFPA